MSGLVAELGASYGAQRARLLARPGPSGPGRRRALADLTDSWLRGVAGAAPGWDDEGLALVAVGGYGRRQLSPGSDVDLLLLHDGREGVSAVADAVWYPVWDAGVRLDHAVRRPAEARAVATEDLPALLGLLDARCVAGDDGLVQALRAQVLADWRAAARRRLPALREGCRERGERAGDVAFALEPDLKEGAGGLRDVHCLRAVAASWVADRPHGDVDGALEQLLDVRDALHLTTGRALDRLLLQEQDAVASRLGLADADSVLRVVASAARTVDYAADVTWRRVERVLAPPRRGLRLRRPPRLVPLGGGLFEHEGEVVLGDGARPDDPVLPLRAAAAAAQRGLPLSPGAVARLAAAPPLPDPWPDEARDLLVALLGAGPGTRAVWEALDQEGVVTALLPEWAPVRSRPQRTAVHRWTVDRHLVETAVEAAARARRTDRPDLLLVAALLHDLGKGRRRGDHSREGAKIVRPLARRMGFAPVDVDVLCDLVLHHLLLVDTATRRDLDDPATAAAVAQAVGSAQVLELLHALTESDAVATGTGVWTDWRAGLVADLVRRAGAALRGEQPGPGAPREAELAEQADLVARVAEDGAPLLTVRARGRHHAVTVVAPDQRGLIAAAAGVLALHRLSVRSADMRTRPAPSGEGADVAVDTWLVVPEYDDEPVADRLREDLVRALEGRLDVNGLLDRREAARGPVRVPVQPARVEVVPGASGSATVLEVRAHDRPALLHRLGRALSLSGLDVRAARVATMGAEVVDVFYVVDGEGRPLTDDRARETARILRDVAG
ncbi:[protein-PII] uridylyltransferase [Vallicoccus soli]|uniref:Bifunctional uridylyltransferase/uridylyl-removing enzyme n=1 Tax=Vallicoccus soli TaxID=2339232 RepID=A0A3A3Z5K9_9ACTN|nr:[protein-PII] uridylyltransferase [Vallicoccus soli]RJK98253.1 [protein-PII] uridylyltransferase [Vallicoccus soli]